MNWELFHTLLSVDSTSGKEREVAQWLLEHLEAPAVEAMEVGDGTLNLFLKWGTPKVVFCTHMDTVPPYVGPVFEGGSAPLLSPCGSRPSMSLEQVQGHGLRRRSAERKKSSEASVEEIKVISGRGCCDAKG
ncbi:MAG: hypothetical protein IJQ35_00910, partial [Bacteroidales bacterium]|nr:hypothetical protein [Bacteroidales bacterium]